MYYQTEEKNSIKEITKQQHDLRLNEKLDLIETERKKIKEAIDNVKEVEFPETVRDQVIEATSKQLSIVDIGESP